MKVKVKDIGKVIGMVWNHHLYTYEMDKNE